MRGLVELEVYLAGELTVVGFGGREILDEVSLAGCREQIVDLLRAHGTWTLAIDLTGVVLMPGGLLGLLEEIHEHGVEILLYNASEDIRETLDIVGKDGIVQFHEVQV
jgi:anti-anti-sigma regulatory factor